MSTDESPETAGKLPPLALIAGPTASGKSDLAVGLGQALERCGRKAVVINADSAQVYADLAVLTARPSPEEMGGIEHRLFGTWDGAVACSAADWAAEAKREIADVHASGGVPILVGGTGLYVRTLLEGIAPVPAIDPAVREAVRAMPVSEAYTALQSEDSERAAKLDATDTTRVARALEVVRSTGKPLGWWQQQTVGGIGAQVALHPAILLPDRQWLYERCDRRFLLMLQRGVVEEVQALLDRKLDPDLPIMRAIGVPEVAEFLAGNATLAEVEARGAQATRNYAKRQMTWLRNQPPEIWPRIERNDFASEDIFARLLHD